MPSSERRYCGARIAGQHNFNADSDPSFHFYANPDPANLQPLVYTPSLELPRLHCVGPWSSTALYLASDAPRIFY
jgi:hypothetical protein